MKFFRRFATKRWLFSVIVVIIAVVAGTVIYKQANTAKDPSYVTTAAKIGNISQSITISGTIEPVTNLELSFGSTGLVNTVNVQPGQSVKAGQVMATLNTTPLQAQVAQAEASVAADKSKLSNDQSGPTPSSIQSAQAQVTNAQNALAAAQQNLSDTQATNQITLQQDQATISQANTALSSDQLTMLQDQAAFANDQPKVTPSTNQTLATVPQPTNASSYDLSTSQYIISTDEGYVQIDQQSLTEAQQTSDANTGSSNNQVYSQWITADNAAISAAQTAMTQANKVISDLNQVNNDQLSLSAAQVKAQQSVDSANQAITNDQTSLTNAKNALAVAQQPTSSAQIQADQAALDAANASLQSAQEALNEATITAPIAGVVAQVNISVGHAPSVSTSTSSGDIVLESPNSFEVSGQISDTQISQVKLNQKALITPAGQTTPLAGKVSQITPLATITQGVATFPVNVLVTDPSAKLFAGASAQVQIIVQKVRNVLTVPSSAIHTLGSLNFVNVLQNGKSTRKLITVGATSGILTEVTSGLSPNELVILANRKAGLPSITPNFKAGRAIGGFGGGGKPALKGGRLG